jgi:hypothetical protein
MKSKRSSKGLQVGFCDRCHESKPIELFSNNQIRMSFKTKQMCCKVCIKDMINNTPNQRLKISYNMTDYQKEHLNQLVNAIKNQRVK